MSCAPAAADLRFLGSGFFSPMAMSANSKKRLLLGGPPSWFSHARSPAGPFRLYRAATHRSPVPSSMAISSWVSLAWKNEILHLSSSFYHYRANKPKLLKNGTPPYFKLPQDWFHAPVAASAVDDECG